MDKILDVIRNRWVKFGFSFLSLGMPAFLLLVDWLAFAYYMRPTNAVPLFLLYVLVNVVFAGIMFYTRKQIITRLVVCITPLIALVLLIIAFGQWYLIIPPVAVCLFAFLASGMNETVKTILGTVYLLLFVVGTLVYLTMLHFNLTVQTLLSLTECDVSKRVNNDYTSPHEKYRLVQYVDYAGNERNLATYYVEKTEDDIELPYLDCHKHLGSQKVLVTMHPDEINYKWIDDSVLYIDGRPKNIDELFAQAEKENEKDEDEKEKEETTEKILTYYETSDLTIDEYYGTTTPEAVPVPVPDTEASQE